MSREMEASSKSTIDALHAQRKIICIISRRYHLTYKEIAESLPS